MKTPASHAMLAGALLDTASIVIIFASSDIKLKRKGLVETLCNIAICPGINPEIIDLEMERKVLQFAMHKKIII